jgi:hypothetical protein
MTASVRSGTRGWLTALLVAAFLLAWVLPGRPVPIYDGVGAPDEPYRYVNVPPGVAIRTAAPTAAKVTVPTDHGVASVIQLATAEQGPQAEVDITDQGLTVAATGPAPSVAATLTPVAPDSGKATPQIDGNVYRLNWSAGHSTVRYTNEGSDLFYLRATVGPPPRAVFLYRRNPGESWRALDTELAGADVYSALVQGPGDYALTRRPFPAAGAAARSGQRPAVPAGLAIVLVLIALMVGAVLGIRLLRLSAS